MSLSRCSATGFATPRHSQGMTESTNFYVKVLMFIPTTTFAFSYHTISLDLGKKEKIISLKTNLESIEYLFPKHYLIT